MLAKAVFCFVFSVYVCFGSWFLVVSSSAIDCVERVISEMTYDVSNVMLNLTHSLRGFGHEVLNVKKHIFTMES